MSLHNVYGSYKFLLGFLFYLAVRTIGSSKFDVLFKCITRVFKILYIT